MSLLEQTQQSFVGLNYSSENDPRVLAGLAHQGEVEAIVDDPRDFTAYDQVVRTLTNNKINWLQPEDIGEGLTEPAHSAGTSIFRLLMNKWPRIRWCIDGILYYSTSLWTDLIAA